MGLNFNFQYMKEEKIRKILKEFTKKKFSLTTK
jgi:hypothetical protein